jgi:hypothetical protein
MRQKVTLTLSNCFGDWGAYSENVNRQKRAFQGEAENGRGRIDDGWHGVQITDWI